MFVGVLRLALHLPAPGSLKSKRHLVRSALRLPRDPGGPPPPVPENATIVAARVSTAAIARMGHARRRRTSSERAAAIMPVPRASRPS